MEYSFQRVESFTIQFFIYQLTEAIATSTIRTEWGGQGGEPDDEFFLGIIILKQ